MLPIHRYRFANLACWTVPWSNTDTQQIPVFYRQIDVEHEVTHLSCFHPRCSARLLRFVAPFLWERTPLNVWPFALSWSGLGCSDAEPPACHVHSFPRSISTRRWLKTRYGELMEQNISDKPFLLAVRKPTRIATGPCFATSEAAITGCMPE